MMKKTLLAIALTAISVTAAHAGVQQSGSTQTLTSTVIQDDHLQAYGVGKQDLPKSTPVNSLVFQAYVQNLGAQTVNANDWGIQAGNNGAALGSTDKDTQTIKTCLSSNGNSCITLKADTLSDYQYDKDNSTSDNGWLTYKGIKGLVPQGKSEIIKFISTHDFSTVEPGEYKIVVRAFKYTI